MNVIPNSNHAEAQQYLKIKTIILDLDLLLCGFATTSKLEKKKNYRLGIH